MDYMHRLIGICFVLECSLALNLNRPKPFGTATIYDDSFSEEGLIERNKDTWAAPSKCTPVQVTVATRHGARNPTTANINSAQAMIDKLRGNIMVSFTFSKLQKTEDAPQDFACQCCFCSKFCSSDDSGTFPL